MSWTQQVRAGIIARALAPHLRPGDRALDIGCGNGVVSRALAKKFGLQLTGTDILDYLRVDLPFVPMKENQPLPFADGSFDTALLSDILHHARDAEILLREAGRVAGQVLVFEDCDSRLMRFVDVALNQFYCPSMPRPLGFRSGPGWMELFDRLGFEARRLEVRHPFGWPLRHMAFRLTRKT